MSTSPVLSVKDLNVRFNTENWRRARCSRCEL